jgi:Protein of unknown function (DUF3311)
MAQSTPPGVSPARGITVAILLLIAICGALFVPIYARATPMLGDFPFFYWYLLIWVPVVAVLCMICYLLLRPKRGAGGEGAK